MPTLKFKIKGIEFDYIGDHGDIIRFIQELVASPFHITSLEKSSTKLPTSSSVQSLKIVGKYDLPSNEAVLTYIVSKPNFQHTLYDVQKHFFDRTFITTDKETIGMYLKTMTQLKNIRKEIENRYPGKFEKKRGKGRLDYYTFKKEEKTAQLFA